MLANRLDLWGHLQAKALRLEAVCVLLAVTAAGLTALTVWLATRPVPLLYPTAAGPLLVRPGAVPDTLALVGFDSPQMVRSHRFLLGEVDQPPLLTSSAAVAGGRLFALNLRGDHVRVDVYGLDGRLERALVYFAQGAAGARDGVSRSERVVGASARPTTAPPSPGENRVRTVVPIFGG